MDFVKMHGCGNDYIYLDCTRGEPEDLPALSRRLSRRRFGVGGDGVICICPSQQCDFRMRMFNADGSEGAMCGNGIRCLGKYVYDRGLTYKTRLTVETPAGRRELKLEVDRGKAVRVTVDMGEPEPGEQICLEAEGRRFSGTLIRVGNPHLVLLLPQVEELPLVQLGPALSRHRDLEEEVNVEFGTVLSPRLLKMRVWERGSGETLSCGTGACALVAAAARLGECARASRVEQPGGSLEVRWEEDGRLYLTGPAETVFEGRLDV